MNFRVLPRLCGVLLLAVAMLVWVEPIAAQPAAPAPLQNPDIRLSAGGVVNAMARQADGGVIFGGDFSSVNGIARNNIARLKPDGALDPDWDPSSDDRVLALAVGANGAVYAGGVFNSIGGQSRSYIAKLSGNNTGAADTVWNPSADNEVNGLAVSGSGAVYVSGYFNNIGGQARDFIAKLSGSGAGDADGNWNAYADDAVDALVVDGSGAVYAGGWFTRIGGQSRNYIAKLSSTGSADMNWNPSADGAVQALAIDSTNPSANTIYAAGFFTHIGGQSRNFVAKLSGSGVGSAIASWNPSVDGSVNALAVSSSGVIYVGGQFSTIGGQSRNNIAKLSGSGSGSADTSWNPSANDTVYALSAAGTSVHVGGMFTRIGGQQRLGLATISNAGAAGAARDAERVGSVHAIAAQPGGGMIVGGNFLKAGDQVRSNLLRLRTDGTLDPVWNPSADGEILALAANSSGGIYASGYFSHIGGQSRDYIAKLSGSGSGNADMSWNAVADGIVQTLVVDSGGAVFAGGIFNNIGGLPRDYIGKLSGSGSGAADDSWNPSPDDVVVALALDGHGSVYASGYFTSIGGQPRNYVAKLSDSGTGAVDANWDPSPDGSVEVLTIDGSAVYVGGWFSDIGNQPRDYIAKLSSSGAGAADPGWNPSADDVVRTLSVDRSGALYVGGQFTAIGGEQRNRIAKLSGNGTGAADENWNPYADDEVQALAMDNNGALFIGGKFTRIGEQTRIGIAALPPGDGIFADGFEH